MSDQPKTQQKQNPTQKEEKKVNEERPQTQQNNKDQQGGDRKPYKKVNKSSVPTKEQILGEKVSKPNRQNDTYVKRPRVEREDFSKLVITLETEIPELPKKNQKIQKPDDEVHLKSVMKIADQIDEQYNKISKFVEELKQQIQKNKQQGKTNKDPLRDIFKTNQDEKKKLYEAYNSVKLKLDDIKNQIEEAQNQAATYKQKMRVQMSKEELAQEINFLSEQQKHGSISIQEEKQIIKKLSELQKSLPYAEPLEQLNVQIKKLKGERDVIAKQLKEQKDKITEIKGTIQEQWETLTNLKNEKDKNYIDIKPLVQAKKDEIYPIIEKLKQQKKDLKLAHYKQWEDFEKQEQLIRKIEFMKKRKAYLQRKHLEEQAKLDAEEKKKQEKEQFNENPYNEEISLCQLLHDYCQKLLPTQTAQQQEVVQKKDLQETLKSDDWKKEKVTEISNRREEELNEFAVSNKKGQKNKKPQQKPAQQQAEQQREVLLNHQIEILQWFEQLSIPAPLLQKQLEETIKQLAQKKKYYEELPVDDTTGYLKPSQKEEEEEQAKQKTEKKKSKKHQEVFNVNEDEFPDMK